MLITEILFMYLELNGHVVNLDTLTFSSYCWVLHPGSSNKVVDEGLFSYIQDMPVRHVLNVMHIE